jgi:hypothetical protein
LSAGSSNFETMSKSRIVSLGPEAERQLERVAVHEAGHEVVAEAFGLPAECFVAGRADAVCTHRLGTPHQNAAISWGGIVAEDLLGVRAELRTLPSVPLTRETLPAWFNEMTSAAGRRQLSGPDLEGILSYPLESSCRAAFDVLRERTAVLRIEAKLLADESRTRVFESLARGGSPEADRIDVELFLHQARQAAGEAQQRVNAEALAAKLDALLVPMPPFPATVEHFMRLIVGEGQLFKRDHAVLLIEFAEHRRARHGEQDWLGIRFETAEHWLCAVDQYRVWRQRRAAA